MKDKENQRELEEVSKKRRLLINTWVETSEFINRKAKEYGCSQSSYAAHILNEHYLESLKS